eukprot:1181461-Prorocentrum_minimum.AAC.1
MHFLFAYLVDGRKAPPYNVLPSRSRGCEGGVEGNYRSSLDARKPQNPTNSEEYQGHLQGVLYST